MPSFAAPLALAALIATPAVAAGEFGLGREAAPAEIAAWDIDVRPDGEGLPEGSGDVATGERLYIDQCASCHGDFGEGRGRWPVLSGGEGTLSSARPVKTVGSYWPFLSTVYDYVHRAMPFGNAQSLSDDEVYAITAYLLYLNYIVEDDFVLSKETFAEVEMPNQGNFYRDDRAEVEPWTGGSPHVCMTDCKESVEITARAAVLDVTPADKAARETSQAEAGGGEAAQTAAGEAEAAPDPELVAAGETVFRQCRACHKIGEGATNGVGPHLNGVIGRKAGGAADFARYSKRMEAAGEDGLVWTEATLAEYLADPRATIKGTRMAFAGLRKEAELEAVIAYLKAAGE